MNKKILVAIIVLLGIILVSHQIRRFEGASTMSSSTAKTIGIIGMVSGSLVFIGAGYILYNYMKE